MYNGVNSADISRKNTARRNNMRLEDSLFRRKESQQKKSTERGLRRR